MQNMLPLTLLFGVVAIACLVLGVRRGWLNADGAAGRVDATTRSEIVLVLIAIGLVAALLAVGWWLASSPTLICGIAALAAGAFSAARAWLYRQPRGTTAS